MLIAFFSNYLSHHQAPVADVLYKLCNGSYYFVATTQMGDFRVKLGYPDMSDKPYLIKTWESEDNCALAHKLALEADVAFFAGRQVLSYQIERMKKGKMSFEVSERWFKCFKNYFSPHLLKNMWYYHTLFHNKPIYKLCASAYAPNDQYYLRSYINKCYKWGYFTDVKYFDIESEKREPKSQSEISIMWCSRFLSWKHPEMVLYLASKLKEEGYKVKIDMYGSGEMEKDMMHLRSKLDLNEHVSFQGSLANQDILKAMRCHDIFLFTSDRKEGWGAVLNEAMSSGCAVVASDEIGASPYLINDGENGVLFKSGDLKSLFQKVKALIDNPQKCYSLGINAYRTMREVWSPEIAVQNLLKLIMDLKEGKQTSIADGPCSLALPYKR